VTVVPLSEALSELMVAPVAAWAVKENGMLSGGGLPAT